MQAKPQTVEDWEALRADSDQVSQIVSEFLRCLGIADKNWSPITSGSCLNVRTDSGFLKIFSPFEDEVETRECRALQLLEGFGLVPTIRSKVTTCGLTAVLLDEVVGYRLDTVWHEMDDRQRSRVLEGLGKFCKDMHALASEWPLPSAQTWWRRNFANPGVTRLPHGLVQEALRGAPPKAAVLVHADLKREHIFVDDAGQLSGIVDFGDTEMAWQDYETVTVALEVCRRDRSALDAFHRGLESELVLPEVLRSAIAHRFAYLAHLAPALAELNKLEELESKFFLT